MIDSGRFSWISVKQSVLLICLSIIFISCENRKEVGKTEILLWPQGKKTAVSLTYDDGSVNQFRIALPIYLKTYIPVSFKEISIRQDGELLEFVQGEDLKGKYVLYQAVPNGGMIRISG